MFKLAVKTIKIHKNFYTFVFIQLLLTFTICICCVSIMEDQLKEYTAFYDSISKDGWIIQSAGFFKNAENLETEILSAEDLEGCLKSAEVLTYYDVGTLFHGEKDDFEATTVVYDEEVVEKYTPDLSEGRWLTVGDNDTDIVEAIVGPNTKGIKAGDSIELLIGDSQNNSIKVRIVGVLDGDGKYFGFDLRGNSVSYHNLFTEVNTQNPRKPVIILLREDVDNMIQKKTDLETLSRIKGFVIISFQSGITPDEIAFNQDYLDKNSVTIIQENLEVFRKNSVQYVIAELMQFFPFLVGVFLYTIISLLCISVLIIKLQLKNFSIYYMLGFPWKKCIGIQLWGLSIVMFMALSVTLGGIKYLKLLNVLDTTLIVVNKWQVIFCLLVIAICLGVSAIVQIFACRHTTPQEIYINSK